MDIYLPTIRDLCALVLRAADGEMPDDPNEYSSYLDFTVAYATADRAKTILMRADQVLALAGAFDRFMEADPAAPIHRAPFDNCWIQFDRPIPEREFFNVEKEYQHDPAQLAAIYQTWRKMGGPPIHNWAPDMGDCAMGILLHQHDEAGSVHTQATIYYCSTAVNRVYWRGAGDTIRDESLPPLEASQERNKQTIRAMALAICAYIGAVNHELTLQEAPAAIQKRRQRENRPSPPPYYTVTIRPQYRRAGEHADGSTGSKHGYMYDVRGHFRRLPDGRLIWIRPHMRGLANELYIPAARKID